jgi:hypothetical protein
MRVALLWCNSNVCNLDENVICKSRRFVFDGFKLAVLHENGW